MSRLSHSDPQNHLLILYPRFVDLLDSSTVSQEKNHDLGFDTLLLPDGIENKDERVAWLKQETFLKRLLTAKSLIFGKEALGLQDMQQSFRELATHARQQGVPCHVLTGVCQLTSFQLRILDIQHVVITQRGQNLLSLLEPIH